MCSFSILSWFRPQATLKNAKGQSSSQSGTGCLTAPLMAGCNSHSLYSSVQMQRWHAGNEPTSFQLLSLVPLAWLSSFLTLCLLLSGQFLPRFPSPPTCQKVRLSFPCDFNHLLIWVISGHSCWFYLIIIFDNQSNYLSPGLAIQHCHWFNPLDIPKTIYTLLFQSCLFSWFLFLTSKLASWCGLP